MSDVTAVPTPARWPLYLDKAAFLFLIAILAWAPFPLGSNRPWSWSLLTILIVLCWLIWGASRLAAPLRVDPSFRQLLPAAILFGVTLLWSLFQLSTAIPQGWGHPIWGIAAETLGQQLPARISIDPWRTATEFMKLATYVLAGLLAFSLGRSGDRANRLMTALLVIVALYAVYGIALTLLRYGQNQLFYPNWGYRGGVAGPFVLHNSYATFLGLGLVLAAVRLYPAASQSIVTGRGWRPQTLSTLQYFAGTGVWGLLALVVIFCVLVATGSRAGFMAAITGLASVLLCGAFLAGRRSTSRWAIAGSLGLLGLFLLLFFLGSQRLQSGFYDLVEAGGLDVGRAVLWDAASRMIGDAPLLGLGLGTFERAYPLYSDHMLPFVMDKAHNDYLELAAGLGLPAAIAWWAAIGWCAWLCLRGLFVRRRNRIYPMAAFGATVIVAFHSIFDFSLQIPAVALTYAVILGLGVAQSFPTRDT